MLQADHRLRKDLDIKKVVSKGRYSYSAELTLKYLPNNTNVSRFAIVVSTKVDKRAVQRNRLKRRLREILRLNLQQIKPGWDILVITKQKALSLDYGQLQEALLSLIKKGRLNV